MYFASLDFKGSQNTTYPYSSWKRDCSTNCLSKTALKKKKPVNKETELRRQFRELDSAIICLLVASIFENTVYICLTLR